MTQPGPIRVSLHRVKTSEMLYPSPLASTIRREELSWDYNHHKGKQTQEGSETVKP